MAFPWLTAMLLTIELTRSTLPKKSAPAATRNTSAVTNTRSRARFGDTFLVASFVSRNNELGLQINPGSQSTENNRAELGRWQAARLASAHDLINHGTVE